MKNKITRMEAEKEYKKINRRIHHAKKMELCGSYRRGEPEVGDLDIVIVPQTDSADLLRQKLCKLGEVLVAGNRTIRIVTARGIQVDFMVVPEVYFESAVLHSTGSKEFNISCRRKAKELGYKLSEYGLVNIHEPSEIHLTEIGILFQLGMEKYIDPKTRR